MHRLVVKAAQFCCVAARMTGTLCSSDFKSTGTFESRFANFSPAVPCPLTNRGQELGKSCALLENVWALRVINQKYHHLAISVALSLVLPRYGIELYSILGILRPNFP